MRPPGQSARKGRPPSGKAPTEETLVHLYRVEGKSVREIGEALDCSKDMVARSLRAYGIKVRTNARRSSLRNYNLEFLEQGIKNKGLRAFARELDIDESTLRHHLRVRKGRQ